MARFNITQLWNGDYAIIDKEKDRYIPIEKYAVESALNEFTEHENKILVVEDGSVDIEKLEKDGFYVIVYRQGSTPPMILGKGEE